MRLEHVWDVTWIRFVVVPYLFIIILLRALVPLLPSFFSLLFIFPVFFLVSPIRQSFLYFLPLPSRLFYLFSSFLYPCLCIISFLFRFFIFLRLLWHLSFLLRLFILLPTSWPQLHAPETWLTPLLSLKPISAHTVSYIIMHPPVFDILLGQLDSCWWYQ
jgi:hypothetical protein